MIDSTLYLDAEIVMCFIRSIIAYRYTFFTVVMKE
jgi:hypothetical protein